MIKNFNRFLYQQIFNNPRVLTLFSVTVLLVYLFPLYYFGEDTRLQVYDNLDIVFPILKVLTSSGMIFASSDAIIPNIMGGLPRLVYGSELNGYVWLFYYFPPFIAFTLNETLIHGFALLSMIVLLSRYFVPTDHRYRVLIIYSVSLMFALLPFYTGAGLSVPSLPLALYAFLNIKNVNSKWIDWLIIILIPFYSSLILVYFFFLLVMTGLLLLDSYQNRKFNIHLFWALFVMSFSFVVVEYRMFYDMFVGHLFVSQRTEFSVLQNHTLWETYKAAHGAFLNGSVDMDTRASVVVLPFMLFSLILTLVQKRLSWYLSLLSIVLFFTLVYNIDILKQITGNKFAMPILVVITTVLFVIKKEYRTFYTFVLLQIFFVYWYALWFYQDTGVLAEYIPILKEFNFARIGLLQPLWWAIITVYGMLIVSKMLRFSPLVIMGVILFQIAMGLSVREFGISKSPLSYKSYYAEDLFTKIKLYIGADPSTYRVGSLGLEPAVAIYNGFYTIDGYVTTYPLEYKHKFQKIIQKSLSENKGNRDLFVGWGSKCYLFDGGQSSLLIRRDVTIKKLQMDMNAFYELGGRYLLSAHKIEQSQMKNLIFLNKFEDKNTFWTIYVYQIDISKS